MIKWTARALEAAMTAPMCAAHAAEPDIDPQTCGGCMAEQLDAAINAQAATDSWVAFLLGRWQDEPPSTEHGRYVFRHTRLSLPDWSPHVTFGVCDLPRMHDGLPAAEAVRLRQIDYPIHATAWWSEPLPERMPGEER